MWFSFRKHRPSYETIALTPRKYWSGSGHSSGSGWLGDPETNIPALLFPKHVLGLHASDDLAFHRDFEVVHSSSRRLMNNGSATLNNGTYPDILNGGRGKIIRVGSRVIWLKSWSIRVSSHVIWSMSRAIRVGSRIIWVKSWRWWTMDQ